VPGDVPLARRAELADNHPDKHENAETICAQPIDQKNESKKNSYQLRHLLDLIFQYPNYRFTVFISLRN
jgi:hypothetical protein